MLNCNPRTHKHLTLHQFTSENELHQNQSKPAQWTNFTDFRLPWSMLLNNHEITANNSKLFFSILAFLSSHRSNKYIAGQSAGLSFMNTEYPSIYFCLLRFPSLMSYVFQCLCLSSLWLFYFIFLGIYSFWCNCKWTIFLISFSDHSLLVHRKATYFCILLFLGTLYIGCCHKWNLKLLFT